ncbi:hypothetical protein [Plantactinospora sp. DSM 117369]
MILYALPGDPVAVMAGAEIGRDVTSAQLDALRHEYGLDRPVAVQYADQLWQLAQGDFGRCRRSLSCSRCGVSGRPRPTPTS